MSDEQKIQRNYYAIIPANVRYDRDLIPSSKLLYGEITALCNETGFCWAKTQYFQDLYGVSRVSIQKWLKSLEANGYISREVIYKENSKEVDKRVIRIVNTPDKEKLATPLTKVNTPGKEKLTENNTSNNTINEEEDGRADSRINWQERAQRFELDNENIPFLRSSKDYEEFYDKYKFEIEDRIEISLDVFGENKDQFFGFAVEEESLKYKKKDGEELYEYAMILDNPEYIESGNVETINYYYELPNEMQDYQIVVRRANGYFVGLPFTL